MKCDIEYAGKWGTGLSVYITKRPEIPAPKEVLNKIEIPGKNGKLYEKTGTYEEIEFPVEFNYITSTEYWFEEWRKIKDWLSTSNTRLKLSDDTEYFYKISHVYLSQNTRKSDRIGVFTATFVSPDGLHYLIEGTQAMDLTEKLYNPGLVSNPLYQITGEGVCTLEVNGKEMSANVGQNLTIDTERMLAYREDGTLSNTSISGNYEDIRLQPRENILKITEGFDCKITPNWRCL